MIKYAPDYKLSTNLAYDYLNKYCLSMPNINPCEMLCQMPNVRLHTYSEYAKQLKCSFREFVNEFASSDFGFTIIDPKSNRHQVIYNDMKASATIKFTLAHELGHIALQHVEDTDVEQREADCFARNLLCPLPLIDGFHLSTINDYVECFGISDSMAKVAIEMYRSDVYYLSNTNYNLFNDKVYCYMTGYTLSELYG